MYGKLKHHLENELTEIEKNGLLKRERVITTPQGAKVSVSSGDDVVIMCANNYLGLSSHPEVIQASKDALDTWLWNVIGSFYMWYSGYSQGFRGKNRKFL